MDELKKYLQQNREQMDIDTPSAELLQRIQKKTAIKPKAKLYPMFVRIAAAACVLAVIFLSVQFLLRKEDKKQETVSSITQPVKVNKERVANINDTPELIPKVESTEKITQQQNSEAKKRFPSSYQLLSSFEQNYNKLVKLQLKTIRNTPVFGESPAYFNGFKISMQQIESDETALKLQIKKNGLNDELLEQLINVYQQKINLLKNLQHEIGNMNNKIKENKQAADSVNIYYINI